MNDPDSPVFTNFDDTFEPTPAGFSSRVAKELQALAAKKELPMRKRMRWLPIAALCALLLASGALAANSFGVLHFLVDWTSEPLDRAAVEDDVGKPLSQSSDGVLATVQARDYLWNDRIFSLAVHIAPMEPDKYRLIGEGDFGVDGIHTDEIWWENEITTMDKWLPSGKQALVVNASAMTIGGKEVACSLTWLPEEQGETFFLQADLHLLTPERYKKLLGDDGTIAVSVPIQSRIYGSDTREQAVLKLTVEAPTVEEWRKLYDGE